MFETEQRLGRRKIFLKGTSEKLAREGSWLGMNRCRKHPAVRMNVEAPEMTGWPWILGVGDNSDT